MKQAKSFFKSAAAVAKRLPVGQHGTGFWARDYADYPDEGAKPLLQH
jgi:hypothetical protein